MRVTNQNKRIDAAGVHNDRSYDTSKDDHINDEKTKDNMYWTFDNGEMTFEELKNSGRSLLDRETDFYACEFEEHIEHHNQRAIEKRHPKRVITAKDYVKKAYSRPEDKILQIGDADAHVDGQKLWECALEYERQFNERCGDHCIILDMSLHMDEETPHVHVRRVWMSYDDYGDRCVGQTRALEDMGILSPLDKENGKVNNAKTSFTEIDRKMFLDICKDKCKDLNIEIEDEPEMRTHKGRSLSNYQLHKDIQRSKDVKESIKAMEEYLSSPMMGDRYAELLTQMKKKSEEEKLYTYSKLVAEQCKELTRLLEQTSSNEQSVEILKAKNEIAQLKTDEKHLKDFIKEYEMEQEYEAYIESLEKEHDIEANLGS